MLSNTLKDYHIHQILLLKMFESEHHVLYVINPPKKISMAKLHLYVLLYWWLQGKQETDHRAKRNKELNFLGEYGLHIAEFFYKIDYYFHFP
jgi:hypothetical protein